MGTVICICVSAAADQVKTQETDSQVGECVVSELYLDQGSGSETSLGDRDDDHSDRIDMTCDNDNDNGHGRCRGVVIEMTAFTNALPVGVRSEILEVCDGFTGVQPMVIDADHAKHIANMQHNENYSTVPFESDAELLGRSLDDANDYTHTDETLAETCRPIDIISGSTKNQQNSRDDDNNHDHETVSPIDNVCENDDDDDEADDANDANDAAFDDIGDHHLTNYDIPSVASNDEMSIIESVSNDSMSVDHETDASRSAEGEKGKGGAITLISLKDANRNENDYESLREVAKRLNGLKARDYMSSTGGGHKGKYGCDRTLSEENCLEIFTTHSTDSPGTSNDESQTGIMLRRMSACSSGTTDTRE